MTKQPSFIPDIWQDQLLEQLRRESVVLGMVTAGLPKPTPNPNFHRKNSPYGVTTVGEFKKFIEENNIPDSATFYDSGMETDGCYDFTWEDKNGTAKRQGE